MAIVFCALRKYGRPTGPDRRDETQILTTDPEARMMKTKDGFACCFNVQTAVDKTSHLIAEFEVTNSCNDYNSLTAVAQKSKEMMITRKSQKTRKRPLRATLNKQIN